MLTTLEYTLQQLLGKVITARDETVNNNCSSLHRPKLILTVSIFFDPWNIVNSLLKL
jgi:hypothetical protein